MSHVYGLKLEAPVAPSPRYAFIAPRNP